VAWLVGAAVAQALNNTSEIKVMFLSMQSPSLAQFILLSTKQFLPRPQ
jgi:hypothetical protein